MNKKVLMMIAVLLGIIFLVLAFLYFTKPANALPSFVPGYDASLTTIHTKHGIGMVILAFGSFAFAWFKSGKKSAS